MTMKEIQPGNTPDERVQKAQQLVQDGFASLIQEMQQGHTERYLQYLFFVSRFHRYSPANQMLIYMQKPDATLVAGYRKWQDLGYQVRRGEHSIAILAPIFRKVRDIDANGQEVEVERLAGFKTASVFDASQLVNPPDEFWARREDDAERQYALVHRAVEASHIQIEEVPMPRDRQGESKGGLIRIKAGLDSRNRTTTLIHEWAHEILHRQWLDVTESRQIPTPIRELQAESVAYVVSQYLGLESPFSKDYLLHYGNTAETLVENMDTIQRASKTMIERVEDVAGTPGMNGT